VKKAVILPVSAPFHCDMMAPAAQAMQEALAETDISAPRVALVNNVTARPTLPNAGTGLRQGSNGYAAAYCKRDHGRDARHGGKIRSICKCCKRIDYV